MKNNKKHLAAKILLTLVIGIYHSVPAYALPNQGTLDNSAAASIATQGTTMSITGKGANNILNWATFSIDKGETVKFTDKSNYLNLVRGVDISRIYGTMSGGGTVYLVNPNGILFGQGARLDNVGSFIASTRNISAINQDAFLNNPNDTRAVLGTDSKEMDNKDYYPDALEYTPKISVADIQLTNVPKSATKIILDGPGGVILKDIEILNKVNKVTTRKSGGEIGIGSDDGTISLTGEQTKKIYVVDENKETAFDNNINAELVEGYRKVKDYKDLEYVRNNPGLYVLENNIDAVSLGSDKTREWGITFDGMGYDISNYSGTTGLFSNYQGTIRNVSLSNVNVEASGRREGGNSTGLYSVTVYGTGGIADEFDGIMNNVSVSGKVVGDGAVGGLIGINNVYSYPNLEIYNSHNDAKVSSNGKSHEALALGGIIGAVYYTNYLGKTETYRSVNIRNVYNNGEILLDHSKRADDYTSDSVAIGGIIGEFTTLRGGSHGYSYYSPNYYLENDYNTPRVTILGSYNTGLIESKLAGSSVKAGGIAGYGYIGAIGESFNFGEVHGSDDNCEGGILGKTHIRYVTADADNVKIFKSQQTKQDITAYYLNSTAGENDESFGISVSSSDMKLLFNPAMFGIYNAETIQSKASGTPIDSKSVDPTPVNPTPVDPTPIDPTPVDPTPVDPTPVNPTPVNPTPVNPTPVDPTPINPTPVDPTPVNPTPVNPDKTKNTSTFDTEWELIKDGVIPQGYKEFLVVMDPNNSEKSEWYGRKEIINDQPIVKNENNDVTKWTYWDTVKWAFSPQTIKETWDYMITTVFHNDDKAKSEPEKNLDRLAGNLAELVKNPYDKSEVSKNIKRQGANGDDIPQEVVDKYVEAVSDALKTSTSLGTPTANSKSIIALAVKTTEGWPQMSNFVDKSTGIEYKISCTGGVQSGITTAFVSWQDADGKYKSGRLEWSGSSDTQSFLNAVNSIGKDSLENVYDALINDSASILKLFVSNSEAELPKQLRNTFGNKITKTVLEKIIKGIGGADILTQAAEITLDAL